MSWNIFFLIINVFQFDKWKIIQRKCVEDGDWHHGYEDTVSWKHNTLIIFLMFLRVFFNFAGILVSYLCRILCRIYDFKWQFNTVLLQNFHVIEIYFHCNHILVWPYIFYVTFSNVHLFQNIYDTNSSTSVKIYNKSCSFIQKGK